MIDFNSRNIKSWSLLGPSGIFGLAVCDIAEKDRELAVLTADLCFFSGLERFKNFYSKQFYNVGIAEQNMIGIAAGMAKEGMNVFATTYATFASTRVMDQVKVNMGYMGLPIKLIGLTSGFSAGILGATHMGIEDIAIMRAIPNITILSPADGTETMKAVLAAGKTKSPIYIRMSGTLRSPIIYREDYEFIIGKSIRIRDGREICLMATGTMVHQAIKAAEMLDGIGISAEVIDFHTIKPIDKLSIINSCDKRLIVTIEEHNKIGGLGAAVAEVLSPLKNKPPHLIIGVDDDYPHAAAYGTLIETCGLTANQIFNKILTFIREIN